MRVSKKSAIVIVLAVLLSFSLVLATFSACGGGITLNQTERTMYVGDTYRLTANVGGGVEVTWDTSDSKVATVRNGTVTAVGEGSATITATTSNGESATCEITVLTRTITISQTEATINLDEGEQQITLTATSSDGGTVTWKSSDVTIATVSGGVVTAVGDNIGDVIITAQRGATTATCTVHVISPSRPEDWCKLEKAQNAAVMQSPGVWYYFNDGSVSNISFKQSPWYGGNAVGVTFDAYNTLERNQYFYFRYQPTADQANDEGQYVMTFTLTMSVGGQINYGQPAWKKDAEGNNTTNKDTSTLRSTTVTAGQSKEVTYFGTITDAEPFHIGPRTADPGLAGASFEMSDISFRPRQPGDVEPQPEPEPEPEQPEPEQPGDEYEMTWAGKADTVKHPDKWFYMVDSGEGKGQGEVVSAAYADGTATLELNNITAGKHYQLRYQPWLEDGYGTHYTATFKIRLTAPANIDVGTDAVRTRFNELAANEDISITASSVLSGSDPFHIEIFATEGAPITVSVSEFSYEKTEVDPNVKHSLEKRTNSETINDPGVWYYFADKDVSAAYSERPWGEGDTVGVTFGTYGKPGDQGDESMNDFYFRYQPEFQNYTATFTVKVGANVTVRYGQPGEGFKSTDLTADEPAEVSYDGTTSTNEPFSIKIDALGEGVESLDGVEFLVTGIEFEERTVTPEPEPTTGYDLTKADKKTVCGDPGKWYYTADGTAGEAYTLAETPKYADGAASLSFTSVADTESNTIQLRYQPAFPVGTKYKAHMTVTVSSVATENTEKGFRVIYGVEGKTLSFGENLSATIDYETEVDGETPFYVQPKGFMKEQPFTITVSDISFTKVEVVAPPDPEAPEGSTKLEAQNRKTAVNTSGVWTYEADNEGTTMTFATEPWVKGDSLGVTFDKYGVPATNNFFYFSYQPSFDDGTTTYTATLTITSTVDIQLRVGAPIYADGKWQYGGAYGMQYPVLKANVPMDVTFEGTIGDQEPFTIRTNTLQNGAQTFDGATILVQNIKFEKRTVAPKPSAPEGSVPLEKKGNADVMGAAGQWFYHVDGGISFDIEPWKMGDNAESMGATFNQYSAPADGKYFYFRYQPKFDDGTTTYHVSFMVTVSANVTIRFGQPAEGADGYGAAYMSTQDVVAGEKTAINYDGTISTREPFSIRIQSLGEGTANLNGVSILVEEFTITARTVEPEPEEPTVPEGSEAITLADRDTIMADAGNWHYMVSNEETAVEYSTKPWFKEDSLGVTFKTYQYKGPIIDNKFSFRMQPAFGEGATYTVSFTITATEDLDLRVGQAGVKADGSADYGGSNYIYPHITANEAQTVKFSGKVTPTEPLSIGINHAAAGVEVLDGLEIKIENITFTATIPGTAPLEDKQNGQTMDNAGQWFYHADGDGSNINFIIAPWSKDNSLGVMFNKGAVPATDNYFYFRIQPKFESETATYNISFMLTVSVDATVRFGQPAEGTDGYGDKYITKQTVTAGNATAINYDGTISTKEPFSIRIDALGEGVKNLNGASIVLTDISITERTIEPEPEATPLKKTDRAGAISAAGTWVYSADETQGEVTYITYSVLPWIKTDPEKGDSLGVTFDTYEGSAITAQKYFYFRYQPKFDDGTTTYTATVTVTASVDMQIRVGEPGFKADGVDLDYSGTYMLYKNLTANQPLTITYEGTMNNQDPFSIKTHTLKGDTTTLNGASILVENIKFEKRVVEPEPEATPLENKSATDTRKTPGVWTYGTDSKTVVSYTTEPWIKKSATKGDSIGVTFNEYGVPATDNYFYFRYQPGFDDGTTTYKITMDITASANIQLRIGEPGLKASSSNLIWDKPYLAYISLTANSKKSVTYEGTMTYKETFAIRSHKVTDPTTDYNGVSILIENIKVEKRVVEIPTTYDLEQSYNNDGIACANPGKWYYADPGGVNYAETPKFDNGTLTISYTSENGSDDGKTRLKIQPHFAIGKKYKVSMKITISSFPSNFRIVYSTSNQRLTDFTADELTRTLTYTGTVQDGNPFNLQLKGYTASVEEPFTVTITDISFTEVV